MAEARMVPRMPFQRSDLSSSANGSGKPQCRTGGRSGPAQTVDRPKAPSMHWMTSRRSVLRHASASLALLPLWSSSAAAAEMAVDRFTRIHTLTLPDNVAAIVTSGWDRPGLGSARYVFDPRVDRDWVRRSPRSATITANGRGFRLDTRGGSAFQYGAAGDGVADDTAAINEALSHGGEVRLEGPAIYRVTDRLLLPLARTRLLFGPSVTLQSSAWRYRGAQLPFGNAIHITGEDCEVIGSGPGSVLDSSESDANGIGFLHCGGGRVAGLTLLGGKRTIAAITDDTFQSGISIINDTGSSRSGRPSRTIVEDCVVTDWMQYGINIYGDLATGIIVRRNSVTGGGVAADRESVGAGIALTRGIGPIVVEDNTISGNKGFGVFVSSAGAEIRNVSILRNRIIDNGREGICCAEEKNFAGTELAGQQGIKISDNRIEGNAAAGIRLGTYDEIGWIRDAEIRRNRVRGNAGSGILLQSNATKGRNVSATLEDNEVLENAEYGIAVGLGPTALSQRGNRLERNGRGASVDYRGGAPRRLP
jgi:hypothetical protein